MDLYLDATAHRRGLARAIYDQVRQAIVDGRLGPGDALPPSRDLARQLAVSRHTVTTAYGFLVAEGFLEGASGAGTRVAALPAALAGRARRPVAPAIAAAAPVVAVADAPRIDLRLGTPDPALFPHDDWRRVTARALRSHVAADGRYGPPEGEAPLRAAIATWIHRSRGVRASADEVLVTAGAQQAFDLVLGAIIRPGDTVAVEDPAYPPFHALARARGARIAPVPVDEHGLVVDALPARTRLVYTTPSHQFPLGPPLSLARRRQLLDWARTTGAVVIEDDYDSEFRFTDRPLEPLQRLDEHGCVLYVGSFSKTLSPSLRTGFVVAPRSLVPALAHQRRLLDWCSPSLLQRALTGFLGHGLMDRHLRRARKTYRARHALTVAWLRGPGRRLGASISIDAGLHLAIELRAGLDEEEVVARARRGGVAVERLSRYALASSRRGIALNFGGVSDAALAEGLRVLARVAR